MKHVFFIAGSFRRANSRGLVFVWQRLRQRQRFWAGVLQKLLRSRNDKSRRVLRQAGNSTRLSCNFQMDCLTIMGFRGAPTSQGPQNFRTATRGSRKPATAEGILLACQYSSPSHLRSPCRAFLRLQVASEGLQSFHSQALKRSLTLRVQGPK